MNSLVVWVVSLTCVGDDGGLGAQAPTVTSVDLCPTELRALSSLQTKGSSEKWLAGSGSGKLTGKNRCDSKDLNIFRETEGQPTEIVVMEILFLTINGFYSLI